MCLKYVSKIAVSYISSDNNRMEKAIGYHAGDKTGLDLDGV
jgi:hypothetical protein